MRRWAEFCELARAKEDRTKHGASEPPRVGVLQRRMEAGKDMQAAGQGIFRAVGKGEAGARRDFAGAMQVGQQTVKSDAAEADDDTQMLEEGNLLVDPWSAIAQLLRCGLVRGWRATPNRGDPKIGELHAVIARYGVGLRGKACFMQNGIQEVSRAVASEWAARAVGAVRAWR